MRGIFCLISPLLTDTWWCRCRSHSTGRAPAQPRSRLISTLILWPQLASNQLEVAVHELNITIQDFILVASIIAGWEATCGAYMTRLSRIEVLDTTTSPYNSRLLSTCRRLSSHPVSCRPQFIGTAPWTLRNSYHRHGKSFQFSKCPMAAHLSVISFKLLSITVVIVVVVGYLTLSLLVELSSWRLCISQSSQLLFTPDYTRLITTLYTRHLTRCWNVDVQFSHCVFPALSSISWQPVRSKPALPYQDE